MPDAIASQEIWADLCELLIGTYATGCVHDPHFRLEGLGEHTESHIQHIQFSVEIRKLIHINPFISPEILHHLTLGTYS